MATRYYYSDPLAAAWMARHHGFTSYTGNLEADDFDSYSDRNWHHCVDDWRYRLVKHGVQHAPIFYLHPESLHLLAPQVGDLVLFDHCVSPRHSFVVSPQDQPPGRLRLEGSTAIDVSDARIILRKGLAFHWPEQHAA